MSTNLSKKDMKLLLYVGGILILILGYFVGWKHFQTRQAQLDAENETLTTQLNKLTTIYTNQSDYKEKKALYDNKIQQVYDSYPAEVKEENTILYASDLEKQYDISISDIKISKANQLYLLASQSAGDGAAQTTTEEGTDTEATVDNSGDTVTQTAADTTQTSSVDQQLGIIEEESVALPDLTLYSTVAGYDFTTGYQDCKSVFASILAFADHRNVPSITLAYDAETGELKGNMSVNMYYLTGTDKEYGEPDSGVTNFGKDDIFGTLQSGGESE